MGIVKVEDSVGNGPDGSGKVIHNNRKYACGMFQTGAGTGAELFPELIFREDFGNFAGVRASVR